MYIPSHDDKLIAHAEGPIVTGPIYKGVAESGEEYTIAQIKVPRTNDGKGGTELVSIIAFGEWSKVLLGFARGDVIRVTGPCGSNLWPKNGKTYSGIAIRATSITRV